MRKQVIVLGIFLLIIGVAASAFSIFSFLARPVGQPSMVVSGTEYTVGDIATIFLQLKDAQGIVVNNAACSIDLYNTTVPYNKIFTATPMINFASGQFDGMYLYQFSTAGYPLGVYPVDATCTYAYSNQPYYNNLTSLNYTIASGSVFGGDIRDVNRYDENLYFALTAAATTNVTYTWNEILSNTTRLDLQWFGETDKVTTIYFYAYNWTGTNWILLGTKVTTASASATNPSGMDDIYTVTLPALNNIINSTGSVRIQLYENQGSTHKLYINFLNLHGYANLTQPIDVRGSSEVHINNIPAASGNVSAQAVWEYINRTLTNSPINMQMVQ